MTDQLKTLVALFKNTRKNPISGVSIHGARVRLNFDSGDSVEFARENTGIDWFTIKLNGQRIHQG